MAIAGLTEEALKLLPIALIVVLAPRRARRFAVIDWLLLGVASGAAFVAVEELFRRIYVTDPGRDAGLLDFCGQHAASDRVECYEMRQFGLWPFGSGSYSWDFVDYAGHHVLTALVTVAVGLAIAAWRASGTSRRPWLTRALAVAAPALMLWIAVVDHMAGNAAAASGGFLSAGGDGWSTAEDTSIPWVVRFTSQVTGGGEGRTLLLVVLFVVAVVIDARRYARYGYPMTGTPAGGQRGLDGDGESSSGRGPLLSWLVTQARNDVRRGSVVVREALGGEVSRWSHSQQGSGRSALLGTALRTLTACGQVLRVLWLDIVQGIAAHSREPGESRGQAIQNGRAFWSMQRQARALICHVDADRELMSGRFAARTYRVTGIATLVLLLAIGTLAAPWVANMIGPELTVEGSSWLAARLDGLAQWWDGLSGMEQLAIGIAGAAILAIPFGFAGGLFAAGIGAYIADHGTGIGDLIEDPDAAVADYAANTSPGEFAWDLGELLLTFVPPVAGIGAKQLAKEYLDDPTAFWAMHRAVMRDAPERGSIRFDEFLARPKGYPDWVAYGGKPRGRLPADFEPGWAAVRQGEKGMAYQQQITGVARLPDGTIPEYVVRNPATGRPVTFDGHVMRGDPPQEVFLEAKDGYADLAINPDQPWARGMKDTIVDEAERQTEALPDGAALEWKVSDPRGAEAIQKILDDKRIFNIAVEYVRKG